MNYVWVTQEVGHDFSPAEEFGEVVFLTKDDFNNMKNSLSNKHLLMELRHKLKSYVPERDWLVIAGSPYVAAAVFTLLGLAHHRQVRILRWDNRDRVYRPMYLEIGKEIDDVRVQ